MTLCEYLHQSNIKELSEKTGICENQVYLYRVGRGIRIKNLCKISKVSGIRVSELMGIEQTPQKYDDVPLFGGICERLRLMRGYNRFTLEHAADVSGVSISTIAHLEFCQNQNAKPETVVKLCEAYHISVDALCKNIV